MINGLDNKILEQITIVKFLQVRSNPIEGKIISAIKCNFETEQNVEKQLSDFISGKEVDFSVKDNHYFLVLSLQHNIPTTQGNYRSDNCDRLELHIGITKEHYKQVTQEVTKNNTNANDLTLFSKNFDIKKLTGETILKLREIRMCFMGQSNSSYTVNFQPTQSNERTMQQNNNALIKFTEMLNRIEGKDLPSQFPNSK